MNRWISDRYAAALLAAGILLTSATAHAANVVSLGPSRGYDNGAMFQLVLTGFSMDTARAALIADGHTITSSDSFTATALANHDVAFLGVFDPGQTLTAAEQSAILNFVRNGGALIYLGDNDRFAVPNSGVAGMFGVTLTKDPSRVMGTQILDATHPIMNGPAGVVHQYDGSGNAQGFCGGIDRLGPYAHALLGTGTRTLVAVIERNALQPGSGPVVFLADANGFMDSEVGGIARGDNAKLLRNIFAFASSPNDGCGSGGACDDDVFCNGAETCVDGACADGNFPCPSGMGCFEATHGCGPCTDNSQCDDGHFCNGTEFCVAGVCHPGTFPCTDGMGCDERDDTCGPCGNTAQCDDGIFCNGLEVCIGTLCVPGSFPCHNGQGCHEDMNTCGPCDTSSQCDNGIYCDGAESCVNGMCQNGTFPCIGGNGCDEQTHECGPCGGTSSCDDGLFCDGVEVCIGGQCQNGTPACDAGLVCDEKQEDCHPCHSDLECDDGLFCTGVEHCNIATGLCQPGTPPCSGLLCEEDENTCAKVSIAVVTVAMPSQLASANDLPPSQTRFGNGDTVYAEVWTQTSHMVGLGCMYTDIDFIDPTCSMSAVSVQHQAGFTNGASGQIVGSRVDEFGGCAGSPGQGVAPVWRLIGRVQLVGGTDCTTDVCLSPAATASTNFSGTTIPPDLISYDCQEIEFGDCIYDLDGDQFVGPGDLALFASCWLCCSDEGCWNQHECGTSDFDCDLCVGPGDLAFFATSWLMECSQGGMVAPPCQSTGGIDIPPAGPEIMQRFNLRLPPPGWPVVREAQPTESPAPVRKGQGATGGVRSR